MCSAGNWLILVSVTTILLGFVALDSILLLEGLGYFVLSLFVRFKQSRIATLLLLLASSAATADVFLHMLNVPASPLFPAIATPFFALLASAYAAINAHRYHRLLRLALPTNSPSA